MSKKKKSSTNNTRHFAPTQALFHPKWRIDTTRENHRHQYSKHQINLTQKLVPIHWKQKQKKFREHRKRDKEKIIIGTSSCYGIQNTVERSLNIWLNLIEWLWMTTKMDSCTSSRKLRGHYRYIHIKYSTKFSLSLYRIKNNKSHNENNNKMKTWTKHMNWSLRFTNFEIQFWFNPFEFPFQAQCTCQFFIWHVCVWPFFSLISFIQFFYSLIFFFGIVIYDFPECVFEKNEHIVLIWPDLLWIPLKSRECKKKLFYK